jgi:hypothetical protein
MSEPATLEKILASVRIGGLVFETSIHANGDIIFRIGDRKVPAAAYSAALDTAIVASQLQENTP